MKPPTTNQTRISATKLSPENKPNGDFAKQNAIGAPARGGCP